MLILVYLAMSGAFFAKTLPLANSIASASIFPKFLIGVSAAVPDSLRARRKVSTAGGRLNRSYPVTSGVKTFGVTPLHKRGFKNT